MPIETFGFDRETGERLLDLVGRPGSPVRAKQGERRQSPTINAYFVEITATEKVNDRYPGRRYSFNPFDLLWVEEDEVWIVDANDAELVTGKKYPAIRDAVVDGRPTWLVSGGCCEPCSFEDFELTGPDMEAPDDWITDTWTSPDCQVTVLIAVDGAGGMGFGPGEGEEGGYTDGGDGGHASGSVTLGPSTELLLELQATSVSNPTVPALVRVSGEDVNGDPFEIYAECGESPTFAVQALGGSAGGSGVTDLVTTDGDDGATPGIGVIGSDGTDPSGGGGSHYGPDEFGSPYTPTKGGYGRIRITAVDESNVVLSLNGEKGSVELVGRGAVVSTGDPGTVEISTSSYESENKEGGSIAAGMAVTVHTSGVGIVKAQADDPATSASGVLATTTANGFSGVVRTGGPITLADWTAAAGSASLLAKATYFLDPSTPGRLTTTPPTSAGQVVQGIGVAVSTDTLDLTIQQPILL